MFNLFEKAKIASRKRGIRNCYFCFREFKPYRGSLDRGWGNFCSVKCSGAHRSYLAKLSKQDKVKELRNLALYKLGL